MNATKKLAISLILFIAASVFSVSELAREKQTARINNSRDAQLVLYYGNGCPSCKIVEDYIKKNELDKSLDLAQKEIWQSETNQKEMSNKAQICGLDINDLKIPMLWDSINSKCYVGSQPIIDVFKQEQQSSK